MNIRRLVCLISVAIFSVVNSFAQTDGGSMSLSLKEAQSYAVENNLSVKSARYDVESSRSALWSVISSALPSVDASGSLMDNLKLTTTLLPGEMMGMPGEKIPVTFGSQYTTSGSIQASMVLFNAPLYLGIASSKLAVALNEKNVEKSELDIKESIASTYYLILVTERTLDILEKNISDLNATLNSTKAMYAAGMAELTDVDQVTTNVTSVTNSKTSTLTTLELNYNMLKFQLGVPVNTQIVLTQTLEDILAEIDVDLLLQNTFDYQQNIDYKLISDQVKLSELSLKSEMSSTLPTLATYYNYGTNGMGDKLNDLRWFQNSVAGLSLSVPIFASGQRYSKIKKARTELEKSKNTQNLLVEQLLIQEQQLRYNLLNANIQYNSQKENIEVAKRVYKNVENKFKQGVASSLELTQSNMQYLTAESNYVNALLTLLQSKLALDKLMNNL